MNQEFYIRYKNGTIQWRWPLPIPTPNIMYFPWPNTTGFCDINPGPGKVRCKRRSTTNFYEEE